MITPFFEKHLPSPPLQKYVDFYQLIQLPISGLPYLYSPATNRNIMTLRFDGDMEVSFKNQEKVNCGNVSITGLSDIVYHVSSSVTMLKLLLVQFSAFGASTLFRINQKSFLNSNRNVEELVAQKKMFDLQDRICSSTSSKDKLAHVEEFLMQFLPDERQDFKLRTIQYCLQLMHQKPEVSIRELSRSVKLSEVHLRRLFQQHVGINPKRYLQLNRFNRIFLHVLEGKKLLKHPYYDDPHLVKEFRHFSGFSPTTYPKELVSTEHILESIPYS